MSEKKVSETQVISILTGLVCVALVIAFFVYCKKSDRRRGETSALVKDVEGESRLERLRGNIVQVIYFSHISLRYTSLILKIIFSHLVCVSGAQFCTVSSLRHRTFIIEIASNRLCPSKGIIRR